MVGVGEVARVLGDEHGGSRVGVVEYTELCRVWIS